MCSAALRCPSPRAIAPPCAGPRAGRRAARVISAISRAMPRLRRAHGECLQQPRREETQPGHHRLRLKLGVAELLPEHLCLGQHLDDLLGRSRSARPVGAHERGRQPDAIAKAPGELDRACAHDSGALLMTLPLECPRQCRKQARLLVRTFCSFPSADRRFLEQLDRAPLLCWSPEGPPRIRSQRVPAGGGPRARDRSVRQAVSAYGPRGLCRPCALPCPARAAPRRGGKRPRSPAPARWPASRLPPRMRAPPRRRPARPGRCSRSLCPLHREGAAAVKWWARSAIARDGIWPPAASERLADAQVKLRPADTRRAVVNGTAHELVREPVGELASGQLER